MNTNTYNNLIKENVLSPINKLLELIFTIMLRLYRDFVIPHYNTTTRVYLGWKNFLSFIMRYDHYRAEPYVVAEQKTKKLIFRLPIFRTPQWNE